MDTYVDGNQKSGGNAPVEVGSWNPHYLQGFIHPNGGELKFWTINYVWKPAILFGIHLTQASVAVYI